MVDASLTDMVVFRENTEDIYAGIEWPAGSPEVQQLIAYLQQQLQVTEIRFPASSGIGIKPVSQGGQPAADPQGDPVRHRARSVSVTLVHKGNIMKFTEGAFRNWGYSSRARSSAPGRSARARGCPSKTRLPGPTSW